MCLCLCAKCVPSVSVVWMSGCLGVWVRHGMQQCTSSSGSGQSMAVLAPFDDKVTFEINDLK